MTGQEVRKLSEQEIKTQIADLRMALFSLRQKSVTDKVEDISQFKKIRHDIARLTTEQTARHRKANPSKHKAAAPEAKVSKSFRVMRAVANPNSKTSLAKIAKAAKPAKVSAKKLRAKAVSKSAPKAVKA